MQQAVEMIHTTRQLYSIKNNKQHELYYCHCHSLKTYTHAHMHTYTVIILILIILIILTITYIGSNLNLTGGL